MHMLFSGEPGDMLPYDDGYGGTEPDWPYNVYAAARAGDSFDLALPSEAELAARIEQAERESGSPWRMARADNGLPVPVLFPLHTALAAAVGSGLCLSARRRIRSGC